MTISAEECAYMVQYLIQKGFISIQPFEDRSGIQHDRYSVEPLWGVLYDFLEAKQAKDVQKIMSRLKSLYMRYLKMSLADHFLLLKGNTLDLDGPRPS
ncbi:hypothetical protein OE903_03875 [Bacillus sp. B6(2022)]|nr:hypothetical protein [Bacillus sp. B6(2022)]